MSDATRHEVSVVTRPLWRIRLARELPRALLCATALAGLLASAHLAIAPPHAPSASGARQVPAGDDRAAEGFAVLFARRFLTWDASAPEAGVQALAPFTGTAMEDAGMTSPSSGSQRVEWAEVVQRREPSPGRDVYTVAAQTDAVGVVYLTVPVQRSTGGALELWGYPAFVGAPASGPYSETAGGREVTDPALVTVLERAVRNYLAGSAGELAADLTPTARVSLPSLRLALETVTRIDWSADGRSVTVVLVARDARAARYTLAYELDVVRRAGRWEIAAVQTDPTA